MMENEFSPLNPSAGRHRKLSLALWWILNIALVVFVFFAFVLSAATLAKEKVIEKKVVTNSQGTGEVEITNTYKVAQNHQVPRGTVVSFTDNPNEVGRGLGPQWETPVQLTEAYTTAAYAEMDALSPSAAVYVFVTKVEPLNIRVRLVNTPATANVSLGGFMNHTTDAQVRFLHVRSITSTSFAILYSTSVNWTSSYSTYLITGTTSSDYSTVTLYTTQLVGYGMGWNVTRDILVLKNEAAPAAAPQSWVLISWGVYEVNLVHNWFFWDNNNNNLQPLSVTNNGLIVAADWPMRSLYLSQGYFVLGTGSGITLAQVNWNQQAPSVSQSQQVQFVNHQYASLEITNVNTNNVLVLSGVQREGNEGPMAMTQIIEYKLAMGNALTVHFPVSLLPSIRAQPLNYHVRSCFIQPDTWHPNGVLLFTYVDSESGMASLVRGKINRVSDSYGEYMWTVPSPRVLISTIPYTSYFNDFDTFGPILLCQPSKAIIAYQSKPATINSFFWHGGYRIAGIAQADAGQGQNVQVTRLGSAKSFVYPLITGYSYYANNSGAIHPMTSLNDLYTPNGWPNRIGVALGQSELLLDWEVVDRINNVY
eukprot:TRINITY_DN303_c0_g1_i3.p1 TRINITY_DN303_c0_g1~~TRINITY_DN303_c0_g1_i3.p1  ORF type:complete len:602 (+),score=160.48 TRINITY_DN303_c0_g1_i3:32-1807(+)